MGIFNRGPRVIDNSTGQDVTPGRGGRHKSDSSGCTFTWGTCDTRSNQREGIVLPHTCAEQGKHRPHICIVCDTTQV